MNQTDFNEVLRGTIMRTADLLRIKGGEYAGSVDRLANFKRGAALTGCSPEQVLFIYLSKHYDAIATFIQDRAAGALRDRSEPIQGRIDDCINYLFLLQALFEEAVPQPVGDRDPD